MVLFVGRLEPIKGTHLLVESLALLPPSVHLVLCGEARDPSYLEQLERAAAAHNVTFLGRRSDVARLMGASDLVVLPSTVAETQGLVIAEAMACGTPVVASDAGGIAASMAGFADQLVPPGDVTRLAAAIGAVIGWRADRPDLGARARQWATDHLSLDATVAAVDELLRRTLSDGT